MYWVGVFRRLKLPKQPDTPESPSAQENVYVPATTRYDNFINSEN